MREFCLDHESVGTDSFLDSTQQDETSPVRVKEPTAVYMRAMANSVFIDKLENHRKKLIEEFIDKQSEI